MPLPTLMVKGRLRAPNGDQKLQKELNEWVPYQYVNEWMRSRMTKAGLRNRVLILKAETASGKSTALMAELYREMINPTDRHAPGIICTQPRTLTAIRNVLQIINIPGTDYGKFLVPGETIGWSTRFNKLRAQHNALISATVGTLTQHLSVYNDEEIMKLYRFIIIDETHERDLETDMTLYMLKNFLLRNQDNPRCPFVMLMSATFDPRKFIEYFDLDPIDNYIWCEGRSVGYDIHWDWNAGRTVNNYPQAACAVVEQIAREHADDEPELGDILIFMPGRNEIIQTADQLYRINEQLVRDGLGALSVMKVDSESQRTESLDYKKLDIPIKEHRVYIGGKLVVPQRRVIIATNFAETGITIPSLKYVIDSGYNKEIEYNPNYNVRALVARPAPQTRITQRMGRVGRIFYGHVYPLYPKFIHEMLPQQQLPQILLEDISPIMLDIIYEQLKVKKLSGEREPEFSINDIDMIDVPSPDALHAALEKLYVLGFISPITPRYDADVTEIIYNDDADHEKFGITRLGAIASMFSMTAPESVRMILAAFSWDCSVVDMVTIAAYLSLSARGFVRSVTAGKGVEQLTIRDVEEGDVDAVTGGTRSAKTSSRPKTKPKSAPRSAKQDAPTKKKKIKPGVNWVEVYKMGAPGFLKAPNEIYKMRALIADEFIDGIFLFNAVKQVIAESEPKRTISDLQKWCDRANLNYDTVIAFVRERDGILEQMLSGGLDVFANEEKSIAKTTPETLVDIITRVKYCIYDGYRLNVIVREGVNYYTANGRLKISSPELFKEDERKRAEETQYEFATRITPNMFVYRELNVSYNPMTGVYDIVADRVSSLDGFVNHDPAFAN